MAQKRWTTSQVQRLVEGAELIAQASGLSVSEVINVVVGEPATQDEANEPDRESENRSRLAGNN